MHAEAAGPSPAHSCHTSGNTRNASIIVTSVFRKTHGARRLPIENQSAIDPASSVVVSVTSRPGPTISHGTPPNARKSASTGSVHASRSTS